MSPTVPSIERPKGGVREGYWQGTPTRSRAVYRRDETDRGKTKTVDAANDIAEFLTTRRAKITPEQAGLPSYGKRRVPGLRREEVASLAGMSVEYYKRLERGNVSGASELVLEGLARALQLDDAERAHLFDLARAAGRAGTGLPKRSRPVKQKIRPVVQRILDQIAAPATVRNARLDYLGANALGRALYAPVFDSREQPPNSARFTFLDPAAAEFYPEWDRVATELVAHLRSEAGRNPYDRQLSDLIGELSTRSDEFRVHWAAHNVRFHRTGTKRIHHPVVGDLDLVYESMELSADGLSVAIFTAEPGSATQQALDLLASWTATPAVADVLPVTSEPDEH
jgi:transcriptional regulator with XRE-family HTH domain